MATIVEMTNPLTGLPEQVDKLDHTAQEIDDAVDLAPQLSNPNLLDNWYFGNPVNQRGKTSWANPSDWQYAIDRWQITSSSVIALVDGGITITADFHQGLEKDRLEFGRTYTFSVISSDGRLGKHTFVLTSDTNINVSFGFGFFVCYLSGNNVWFRIYGDGSTYKAAKLELGSRQTLAHQENGVWVLNEIPDFGEQLARCQRYRTEREKATGYVSYSSGGAVVISPMAGCSFPTTMRSNPSCAIFAADVAKTANKVSYYSNFESIADGTVASVSADDNGIYSIGLQNSSIQVGTIVEFCYVATAEL